LDRSSVTDIHMTGRRTAAHAKFTTKELRELGELGNADVLVDPAELELDDAAHELLESDATARRNYDVLAEWAQRPLVGRPRRIHMHFLLRPSRLIGTDQVSAVELERMKPVDGNVIGTGDHVMLDAQLVLRSIGYQGIPIPD